MKKNFWKVTILMNTAFALNIYSDIEKVNPNCYAKLFDTLMYNMEHKQVLFDYVFEQVKFNMFELAPISFQKQEFIRLVNLTNLNQEFNNSLNQFLQCLSS